MTDKDRDSAIEFLVQEVGNVSGQIGMVSVAVGSLHSDLRSMAAQTATKKELTELLERLNPPQAA